MFVVYAQDESHERQIEIRAESWKKMTDFNLCFPAYRVFAAEIKKLCFPVISPC